MTDEVENSTLLTEEITEELAVVEDGATGVKIVERVVLFDEKVKAGTEAEVVAVD